VNGIIHVPMTVKNPQSNAICKHMHQMIANISRILLHSQLPRKDQQAADLIDTALAMAMYATRASIHHSLSISPGALAFQRDMILNIPLIADLELIRQRRQVIIDDNLR
jgi:hypothetical protein